MKADLTFDIIKSRVKEYEDEARFAHTLSVVEETEYICRTALFDEEKTKKACLAALLHDITKNLTESEQEELYKKYNIKTPSLPPTMHEKTGAYFAREIFGNDIVDDDVFSAIFCHTTGRKNMSDTDMALFIADFTEKTRKYKNCRDMREYLHSECEKIGKDHAKAHDVLSDVTLKIIAGTIGFLVEKYKKIDAGMIEAWNSMI
ncbi:MAG: bis(5'-nucleosyl)-tetraphosphatase (symmetrical) YqeK [Eubacteriales bacterium]